jgi:hypothetical protein
MYAVNFFVDNVLANYKYPQCHELFPARELARPGVGTHSEVTRAVSLLQIRISVARG